MALPPDSDQGISRRKFLLNMGMAPVLLRSSPFRGFFSLPEPSAVAAATDRFPLSDPRYIPRYPAKSPLEGVLRLVAPGSDEYIEERYAVEIEGVFKRWESAFTTGDFSSIAASLHPSLEASHLTPIKETALRPGSGVQAFRREYDGVTVSVAPDRFLSTLKEWIGPASEFEGAVFEITALDVLSAAPLTVRAAVRCEIVASRKEAHREECIGAWITEWLRGDSDGDSSAWKLTHLKATTEMRSVASEPVFVDVTQQSLGRTASYQAQMLYGSDHWRTVLDGACGIDVYGNNGIAAGDFDNDGFDDLYISQPAGLPNRLYRNRGDGTFEDVTESAGVGVLDNTSCALFADLRDSGLQDLLVVCGSGPLLFLNQGDGTFKIKRDAFKFARTPQGTFTHAAIADYDRDGRLDIYFCLYSYYLGLDQYHYPVPYFDARNGPPNFLLHNEGDGTFTDRTEAAGLNAENDRYSFACAWQESPASHMPDLYVVNDFGRNNLYRNNGDGSFTAVSAASQTQDVGAGMSASWLDFNNDGNPDIYVANMWSAAGQRVSGQPRFHAEASQSIRALYQRHARGNALYQNNGDGIFRNVGDQAGVDAGRWAWCSDSWDFDHDGFADLYVTNGYISALASNQQHEPKSDLGSFFWRQVVGKSPDDSTPSQAYEHGWNAINELIRSDNSWNGFERNALFANNRDGTFSDVSAVAGMGLIEDGRSFALADIDHDGRLEVIVKNRNAPQLRVLHNVMKEIGDSIAFRLRGKKSNRDAIGTVITLKTGTLTQTKSLQAGSGFLAQHSKELFFGLGNSASQIDATVRWPSGLTLHFERLPRNSRIHLEEGSANFDAKPFATASTLLTATTPETLANPAPDKTSVETWLLDPLKAPAFSLPDFSGTMQQLHSLQSGATLLCFWSTAATSSTALLRLLHEHRSALDAAPLKIIAINLDPPAAIAQARIFAQQQRLFFAVLFATEEVAGIYNIVYRYLFDRRRDLPIPASFLLDRDGMIVKLYQGAFTPARVMEDARSIPATPAERMKQALPFPGTLYQSEFRRNDYTYGVAMFQHGYLEQAEDSFKQVVAARPDDAEGYYNLGTLSLRRNNFADARSYLEQTLKLKPDYPEAWNNLGMIAAQQGRAGEAIANFKQSIAQRPNYATALLNLGNVYRRQGSFAEAKDSLTRALALEPDDPEANYSLGMFYAQQGQLQPAEEYLHKAVALRPDYAEALNNLGVISVRKQDYATAEEQFKTCIRIVPAFDQAYLNLARLYIAEQDKPRAASTLNDLLRIHPESAAARQALQSLNSAP
jgi:Flp pilus assembly protein TadD/peroxiredoxin